MPPSSGIEPTWVIEPDVRIGAIEGGGPYVFGEIRSIAPLPDGPIAVLDGQAQEIRIFAADGEYLRTLGRPGAGPGEFGRADGILVSSDGLLLVRDPANSRLSYFNPDGDLVAEQRVEIFVSGSRWEATTDEEGKVYEWTTDLHQGSPWSVINVYDATGVRVATIPIEPDESIPVGAYAMGGAFIVLVPFWPQSARALDPSGHLWRKGADVNSYRIARTTFLGDTLLVVESSRPAVAVSRAERDSAIAAISENVSQLDWSRIPDEKPIVEGIYLSREGDLWVRVAAADTVTTYDIFGRDGGYVGTAVTTLQLPSSPDPVVVGDRFYAVATDELGVPYVIGGSIREVRGDQDGGR